MSGGNMTWCPSCTRLLDNYNAAISRGARHAAEEALRTYDTHRDTAHGRGSG